MNIRILGAIGMIALLVATASLAFWLGARDRTPVSANSGSSQPGAAGEAGKAALYWYDPMVPDQHFDKPGKSPFMDMQLVPKYAATGDAATISVNAATRQNLGLRTAAVEVGVLAAGVEVPGIIDWDQRKSHQISARADGVIERLFVRAPYEPVKAGQALAELVAPEWNAATREYLALEKAGSADARSLREAARSRLRVLGMDDAQIRGLRAGNRGIVLRAPVDGVVDALSVREGERVQAGRSLMVVNALDTVWVNAAIPQSQSAGIVAGSPVKARLDAFPGEEFTGTVEALLPVVDPATRTQRARIVLENPGQRLSPGMFANLRLSGTPKAARALIPDSALIASGSDARVIVENGEGRFVPVAVVAGRSANGRTEILQGLEGGERVVVSGQFLIDSEASLSGAFERMQAPQSAGEDHAGHDAMPGMKSGAKGAQGEHDPDSAEPRQ